MGLDWVLPNGMDAPGKVLPSSFVPMNVFTAVRGVVIRSLSGLANPPRPDSVVHRRPHHSVCDGWPLDQLYRYRNVDTDRLIGVKCRHYDNVVREWCASHGERC